MLKDWENYNNPVNHYIFMLIKWNVRYENISNLKKKKKKAKECIFFAFFFF